MLLHGNTTTAYTFSSFVICTIHQLYRFYRSFDLLVIDEIDAFPYSGDAGLAHAVQTAIKSDGRFIYLSATPDEKLLKEIKQTFDIHKLALRFHRRLLPEPVLVFMNNWRQKCGNKKKINSLVRIIQQLIKENHILLFCPSITMMHRLKVTLQEAFPEYEITDVSSQDDQRAKKVQKMREATYEILLTTMILERGVTFERISVIVLGADHPVFTKSSLVQIAGRADRKGPYTNSRVYFSMKKNFSYSKSLSGNQRNERRREEDAVRCSCCSKDIIQNLTFSEIIGVSKYRLPQTCSVCRAQFHLLEAKGCAGCQNQSI